MRTHNIPSCYRKIKEILIMPPELALLSTLIGSNYPCLKLIFMVPKEFKPLKFDCKNKCILYIKRSDRLTRYYQENNCAGIKALW